MSLFSPRRRFASLDVARRPFVSLREPYIYANCDRASDVPPRVVVVDLLTSPPPLRPQVPLQVAFVLTLNVCLSCEAS